MAEIERKDYDTFRCTFDGYDAKYFVVWPANRDPTSKDWHEVHGYDFFEGKYNIPGGDKFGVNFHVYKDRENFICETFLPKYNKR